MNNWQPIETAPKDGKEILGTNGKYYFLCRWYDCSSYDERGRRYGWVTEYDVDAMGYVEEKPTHWINLPALP